MLWGPRQHMTAGTAPDDTENRPRAFLIAGREKVGQGDGSLVPLSNQNDRLKTLGWSWEKWDRGTVPLSHAPETLD